MNTVSVAHNALLTYLHKFPVKQIRLFGRGIGIWIGCTMMKQSNVMIGLSNCEERWGLVHQIVTSTKTSFRFKKKGTNKHKTSELLGSSANSLYR
jgi:hypothetical protein